MTGQLPPTNFGAATGLSNCTHYMIPPAQDILYNPIETHEGVVKNQEFLLKLARPFTLYIHSLRTIPNTKLNRQMGARNISMEDISANYIRNTLK